MTSQIFRHVQKIETVRNLVSEKSWEPCSLGWEMVGDEGIESWEMVENLLNSKVWVGPVFMY